MDLILNLETSTKNCSVSLFNGDHKVLEKSVLSEQYSHSENLTIFIQEVISRSNFTISDLAAVSVSKGPGSYTGLRVAVAVAKGLCYTLDIPLISISNLEALSYKVIKDFPNYDLYCPMIDARRMEVFSAIFDRDNKLCREIKSEIITSNSFKKELKNKMLFFGNGSEKCKSVITSENAFFLEEIYPSSSNMGILSFNKFKNKKFEDIAYFEPLYLKDFI